MEFDVKNLEWTREPAAFDIADDTIRITTAPATDLWQRTYYHFRNDNAPVLQMATREKFFSFVVKTDFADSHTRFDQCGVVLYLDSENWLKGSIEYENEEFQHLGSVVTNHGYSDWATTEIPATVKSMWYRLSRREDDFCIECSDDGEVFRQMRVCHLHEAKDDIRFGIYACSPEQSSFTAVFTGMAMTECKWLAHDGQQPDDIQAMDTNEEINKMRELIEQGWSYCNQGMHMEAVDAFRDVFDKIPFNSQGERKQLLDEAYRGLCELHSSDDEYTWERTGVLFDYMDWRENHQSS